MAIHKLKWPKYLRKKGILCFVFVIFIVQFFIVKTEPDTKQDAELKAMTDSKMNIILYNSLKNLTAIIELSTAVVQEFNNVLGVYDANSTLFILENWGGVLKGANNSEKYQYVLEVSARTFARPWKKMALALIPLVFHAGATSMWMSVSSIAMTKLFVVSLVNSIAIGVSLVASLRRSGQNTSDLEKTNLKLLHIHNHLPGPEYHKPYVEHTAPAYFHDSPPLYGPTYHSSPQYEPSYHSSPQYGPIYHSAPQYGPPHHTYGSSYHGTPYQRTAYHDEDNGTGPQTINTPYGQYVKVGPPSK